MSGRAEIFEVGPRDGLQNEERPIPTAEKIALVDCLSRAGFRRIEVASFVSPKWVPQMADGAEVLAGIRPGAGRALRRADAEHAGASSGRGAAGADEIAVFASASEGFSRANLNCSIEESLDRFAPGGAAAAEAGLPVRGYVSCVTDCPFDGPTPPEAVARGGGSALRDGLPTRSRSATRSGGARPRRSPRCSTRCSDGCRPTGSPATSTTPAGGRSTTWRRRWSAGCGSFDAAVGGPRRLPLRAGGGGERCDRGGRTHGSRRHGCETGLDAAVLERAAEMARAMRDG